MSRSPLRFFLCVENRLLEFSDPALQTLSRSADKILGQGRKHVTLCRRDKQLESWTSHQSFVRRAASGGQLLCHTGKRLGSQS